MGENRYDAVVIGSGRAGAPLAIELARRGMQTALLDGRFSGSESVGERVITKSLPVSASVARMAARAHDFGVKLPISDIDIDYDRVRMRAGDLSAASGHTDELQAFATDGITAIGGYASFLEPDTVMVVEGNGQTSRISAPRIFINTGSRVTVPDIPGIAEAGYVSGDSVWMLENRPNHLAIIGGGYLGVELAQAFRLLGSGVTIIQRNARLLPGEDMDMSEAVLEVLQADGVEVMLGSVPVEIARQQSTGSEPSPVRIRTRTLEDSQAAGEETVTASDILIAAGRTPNTNTLHLGKAGIETDERGSVIVNDRLETTAPGVWALGDVTGGPTFASLSLDDVEIVIQNLFGDGRGTRAGRVVSSTVFTNPPIARVGLREAEIGSADSNTTIRKVFLDRVPYARDLGQTEGFIKSIIDTESGTIRGFSMIGPGAVELAGAVQIAMLGNIGAETIGKALFAQPTMLEALKLVCSAENKGHR